MKIAALNDRFRQGDPLVPGVRCQTSGVTALPEETQRAAVQRLVSFDPYGEHDFGAFDLAGVGRLFFKIDYYADQNMEQGTEHPESPQTFRTNVYPIPEPSRRSRQYQRQLGLCDP